MSGARATIRRLLFCVFIFFILPSRIYSRADFWRRYSTEDEESPTEEARETLPVQRAPAPKAPPAKRALGRAPVPAHESTPIERALGRTPVPAHESTPIERALRRVRVPEPAPKGTLSLRVKVTPPRQKGSPKRT